MFAPTSAPRTVRRSSPPRRYVRAVVVVCCWAFAALWPFVAFALLAFVVSDPLVTPLRLLVLSIVLALGSCTSAVFDGVMLTNTSWWTTAQL